MVSAEGGSVPSGVGYGDGCPLPSRLEGLGSVVSGAPAENGIWRILKAAERSFFVPTWPKLRETIYISVPYSKFWGDLSPPLPSPLPRDLRPWLQTSNESLSLQVLMRTCRSVIRILL